MKQTQQNHWAGDNKNKKTKGTTTKNNTQYENNRLHRYAPRRIPCLSSKPVEIEYQSSGSLYIETIRPPGVENLSSKSLSFPSFHGPQQMTPCRKDHK